MQDFSRTWLEAIDDILTNGDLVAASSMPMILIRNARKAICETLTPIG